MKTVCVLAVLLAASCGDDLQDPTDTSTTDLINADKMAAGASMNAGVPFASNMIRFVVPQLSGTTSGQVAIHATVDGFLRGSLNYFEGGFLGTTTCSLGSCSSSWITFVDFLPSPWVVSPAIAVRSGDTVSVTVQVGASSGVATFVNETLGTSGTLSVARPQGLYVGDSTGVVVERIGIQALARFGTWPAYTLDVTWANSPAQFGGPFKNMTGIWGATLATVAKPSANVFRFTWKAYGP